jgi:hypothetical protein
MDVKEAVTAAKQHIQELFKDEELSNLGLEDVEYNELEKEWQITIGFSRSWDRAGGIAAARRNIRVAHIRSSVNLKRLEVSHP